MKRKFLLHVQTAILLLALGAFAPAAGQTIVDNIVKLNDLRGFALFGRSEKFTAPAHIAVNDATRDFAVSDTANGAVYFFNLEGRPIEIVRSGLEFPQDVLVRENGFVYIAQGTGKIAVLDPQFKQVKTLNLNGTGKEGEKLVWEEIPVDSPSGGGEKTSENDGKKERKIKTGALGSEYALAASKKGRLYVLDSRKKRILALDENDEALFEFGKEGDREGQFLAPRDLETDALGNVYVLDADRTDYSVLVFNWKGDYLYGIPRRPAGADELVDPVGLSLDRHKRIWVADAGRDKIRVYDALGAYLFEWDGRSKGNDFETERFFHVVDMGFDLVGRAYVIEGGEPRIRVYQID